MSNRLINSANIPPLEVFDIEIPDFTIITGVNGAGKSRLIDAIASGQIKFINDDGREVKRSNIQVIRNPSGVNPFSDSNSTISDFSISNMVNSFHILSSLNKKIISYPEKFVTDANALKSISPQEVGLAKGILASRYLYKKLKGAIENTLGSEELDPTIQSILDEARSKIEDLSTQGFELADSDIPYFLCSQYVKSDPAIPERKLMNPESFALLALFQRWVQRLRKNDIDRHLRENRRIQNNALSDEEFVKSYGEKPWVEVNRSLEKIGSDLRFFVDETNLYDPSTPNINLSFKDMRGNIFPATGISTGERIIFSIAMRKFAHLSTSIKYKRPMLLLLDESDAHLHPSLCGHLIELIHDTLINLGTKVILTTHSPATVAHSPEGNLLVLSPFEAPALASRREAMNVLLSGQEKFFIDLSGSRTVFVEDQTDVVIFENLASIMSNDLSKIRLEFKSLSNKSRTGKTSGGGKDAVKKLVSDLGENNNFRGLIDFDNTEKSSGQIHVLCEGERYAIENALLDPRILAFILLRHDTQHWAKHFEIDIKSCAEYSDLPAEAIQRCMFKVEKIIFQKLPEDFQKIQYADGKYFKVSRKFLKKNGHQLYDLVERNLKIQNKSASENVLEWIAKQILMEMDDCIPMSVIQTLNLLAAD